MMYTKKILILFSFLFLASNFVFSQEKINWISFEEAQKKSKTKSKKIFVDVYTLWCGPCKMLDKNTFSNKDVIKYINENYYAVKFNAESPKDVTFLGKKYSNKNYVPNKPGRNSVHDLTRLLRVSSYPTLMFMDSKFNIMGIEPGYKDYKGIEIVLKFYKNNGDDFLAAKTKEEKEVIINNFKPKFQPKFQPN